MNAPAPYHLPSADMSIMAEVFQESVTFVLNSRGTAVKEKLGLFCSDIILKEKAYLLVTPEGLKRAIDLVFTDDDYRDFIFTLAFTFTSRCGMSKEMYSGLVANLAMGACPVYEGTDVSAVPNDIASRLGTFSAVTELLEANQWLTMLLLLQLFVSFNG